MSEEAERIPASDILLTQLATDPITLSTEGTDMAQLGVIPVEEQRLYTYIGLRGELFDSRFFKKLFNLGLRITVGVGGRGRVDTLKAASVALGGPVHTEADLVKPNWVVRNIVDKNWEDRQRKELGLPPRPEEG